MPNLRGASPVDRDDGGLPYAARSISKVSQEMEAGIDEDGGARSVTRLVAHARKWAYRHVRSGRVRPEDRDPPEGRDLKKERRGDGLVLRLMGLDRSLQQESLTERLRVNPWSDDGQISSDGGNWEGLRGGVGWCWSVSAGQTRGR